MWDLTEAQFDSITAQECHYCHTAPQTTQAAKSGDFIYNGLDRKDNDVGYTRSNAVACCTMCNRAKGTTPYDQFLAWLAKFSA